MVFLYRQLHVAWEQSPDLPSPSLGWAVGSQLWEGCVATSQLTSVGGAHLFTAQAGTFALHGQACVKFAVFMTASKCIDCSEMQK